MDFQTRRNFVRSAALVSGASLVSGKAESAVLSTYTTSGNIVTLIVKPETADATAAIQQALTYAAASGKMLRIPGGDYYIAGTLSVSMVRHKPFSITGDGAAITNLYFTGSGGLQIDGNFATDYDPDQDRVRIQGLTFNNIRTTAGIALHLQRLGGFSLSDFFIVNFDIGLLLDNSLKAHVSDGYIGYCNTGVLAPSASYSTPSLSSANLLLFTRVGITECANYGLSWTGGTSLTLDSCEIANNKSIGVAIHAKEGLTIVTLAGTNYFEANAVNDVYILHQSPASYNLTGAFFNFGNLTPNSVSILLDANQLSHGSPRASLNLEGSGFQQYRGRGAVYVSALIGAGYDGLSVSNRTTIYVPSTSTPNFAPPIRVL